MLKEELKGLNRQIEFCLTTAYDKGFKAGQTSTYNDEEKAIDYLRKTGWLVKHDEEILTQGIRLGQKLKAEEKE